MNSSNSGTVTMCGSRRAQRSSYFREFPWALSTGYRLRFRAGLARTASSMLTPKSFVKYMSGEVCAHEMGYREEHARLDRLFLRACGRHTRRPFRRAGLLLLDLLESEQPGSYCACDDLEPNEWFSYGHSSFSLGSSVIATSATLPSTQSAHARLRTPAPTHGNCDTTPQGGHDGHD